jgi:hypothetical protein
MENARENEKRGVKRTHDEMSSRDDEETNLLPSPGHSTSVEHQDLDRTAPEDDDGIPGEQFRVLLAVSLVSKRGWILSMCDSACHPSTYPAPSSWEQAVLEHPTMTSHYRINGFYFTSGTHPDVEKWAVEHKLHVIRKRMVFPDTLSRHDFTAFAPIWVDDVRHAIIVDVKAFGRLFSREVSTSRFSAIEACKFFANAYAGTLPEISKFFDDLLYNPLGGLAGGGGGQVEGNQRGGGPSTAVVPRGFSAILSWADTVEKLDVVKSDE